MKIALVGGGPKALAALTHLDRELARVSTARSGSARSGTAQEAGGLLLSVDVYEPQVPGAGAVWDTATPSYLLLNVSPKIVDYSGPSFPNSYLDWALLHPDPAARQSYPPRALMGQYLREAFLGVKDSRRIKVNHVRERVTRLSRLNQGWLVECGTSQSQRYDVVLLATGHVESLPASIYEQYEDPEGAYPAGSDVLIEGAALTAIDIASSLTVGRGGEFRTDQAGCLRYERSGAEPWSITLVSRSGVPLSPKPTEAGGGPLGTAPEGSENKAHYITQSMAALSNLHGIELVLPNPQWWETLGLVASDIAAHFGCEYSPSSMLEELLTPEEFATQDAVLVRLQRHTAMNNGEMEPDPQWLWGRIWQIGYPSIIDSLGRKLRDPHQWELFRTAARNAERWAYGPPQETVDRLIALTESGTLRWKRSRSSEMGGEEASVSALTIRAVTRPPGILDLETQHVADPLWGQLIDHGHVHVREHERGVFTLPTGQCVGSEGEPTRGLYAVGRPTEDPVIGHDTLSHTMHPDIQLWAQHIVENLTEGNL